MSTYSTDQLNLPKKFKNTALICWNVLFGRIFFNSLSEQNIHNNLEQNNHNICNYLEKNIHNYSR